MAGAAAGILDEREQRLLLRRRARAWTTADGPLVDEAKDLISGQSRTYGHAIVDEAQDLSPMQLRMLARRCPSGSMTLLGDLAQGIGVWAHSDWRDLTQWLPTTRGVRVVELRYGYRSPSQVLALASRLLPFDAVLVVEPSTIAGRGARGLRLLYVALTRPTQHLSIVSTTALPAALVS
jgi:DNA helicase IV